MGRNWLFFGAVTGGAVAMEAAWLWGWWSLSGAHSSTFPVLLTTCVAVAIWTVAEATFQQRFCGRGSRREGGGPLELAQGCGILAAVAACVTPPAPPFQATAPMLVAGLLATATGIALRCAAIAQLRSHFHNDTQPSPGQPLLSDGVFRYIHHPAETGLLLAVGGMALAAASPVGLGITALVLLPLSVNRTRQENRSLHETIDCQ